MFSFIRGAASRQGFDNEAANKIQLACEEALVNVINYAYPDKDGELEIAFDNKPDALEIQISDSGIPFDPLALAAPDITAPMEERKIGGLGIYMIRKLMDQVSYKRENDRNVLTLIKKNGSTPIVPGEAAGCRWPITFMKLERFKKGDTLFKAGDKADRMFYIKKGAIRLVEINKVIPEGEVIGEMGIFSPFKQRTASAVCEEDLEAYTMGRDEVIKFFAHDPAMALDLIEMSIKRFIENLKAETASRERIESELRIAQEIQASMLPQVFPQRKEFEIFAMMDPAKEVGGDFYDFFFVDDKRLCFVIGDVSGKGVPAALFMTITKTLIKTKAKEGLPTNEILSRVNNILYPDNQSCLFVTVFCAILNMENGNLQYCNAGHNPPLLIKVGGAADFIKVPAGMVMGVMEQTRCGNNGIVMRPGESIVLYTDGVTEAMDPEHQQFTDARLKATLSGLNGSDMKTMIGKVRDAVYSFARGAAQSDDITMLAVKYKGDVPKGTTPA